MRGDDQNTLVLKEVHDIKQELSRLAGLLDSINNTQSNLQVSVQELSDRLLTAESNINNLNGSVTDIYFANRELPFQIVHNLGTLTPFVTIYCNNELALYQVRIINQYTIEIDSPVGYISNGYVAIRK